MVKFDDLVKGDSRTKSNVCRICEPPTINKDSTDSKLIKLSFMMMKSNLCLVLLN